VWKLFQSGIDLFFASREKETLYYWEREEIIAIPGVLLLLAPAALAKPSKLHPVEK
jgi:hypothetical protein